MAHLLDLMATGRCHGCGIAGSVLCESCSRMAIPAGVEDLDGAERAVCAWRYVGAPRSLVLGLKLRRLKPCSPPLERALYEAILRHGLRGDILTWVPARPRDVRRRGFDHAEVLARGVGALSGLPVRGMLRRVAATPDQGQLGRSERVANLSGAFVAAECSGRVVLVDDLVTTGATARACSAALRAAGAARVEILAACRA